MKRCTKCTKEKEFIEFGNDKNRKDGKSIYCKICTRSMKDTDERREKSRKYQKAKRDNNPILRLKMSEQQRVQRYRKFYDISIEDYNKMLEFQDGRCAICNKHPKNRRLAVDHDHKTGKIRGLLCAMCNQSLHGRITQDWLFNAYEYLNLSPAGIALGRVPVGQLGRVNKRGKRKPK